MNATSTTVAAPRTAGSAEILVADGSALGAAFPQAVPVSRGGSQLCILEVIGVLGDLILVAGATGGTTDVDLYVGDSLGSASGGTSLDSPAFTGVPTAPTAAPGTDTTQVATTAFVIANGGGGAVSSVAGRTGVVTLAVADVSGAAPLASPTFTGTPAAPTPTASDSTTKLATTAFVKGQGYLTTTGDASAATATVAGTGTVARTLAARFGEVFDPMDFGAIGNGTHDDTAAWQATINAVIAAGGGLIRPTPPPVNYNITSTLTATPIVGVECYVGFEFHGPYGSIRWGGGNNTSVFRTLGLKYSTFEGLYVYAPSQSGVVMFDLDITQSYPSTSANTFTNCGLILGPTAANCIGWRGCHSFNQADGVVGESSFNTFNNCLVICAAASASAAATAGHVGWSVENPNVLNWVWVGGGGSGLAKVFTNQPSTGAAATMGGDHHYFYGFGGTNNALAYDLFVPGAYGIHGGRWETGARFLWARDSGSAFGYAATLTGVGLNNYSPSDNVLFQLDGAGSFALDGCRLSSTVADYTAAAITLNATAGVGSLRVRGGILSAADPCYTISAGEWDVSFEGSTVVDQTGATTGYLGIATRSGQAVLASAFTITADSTWQDTGLSVSLPSAGTYLIGFNVCAVLQTGGSGGQILAQVVNGAGADYPNATSLAANDQPGSSRVIRNHTAFSTLITTTSANTVHLQAYRLPVDGTTTFAVSEVSSDGSGYTRLNYTKVS